MAKPDIRRLLVRLVRDLAKARSRDPEVFIADPFDGAIYLSEAQVEARAGPAGAAHASRSFSPAPPR
ncbi:hypothetical protein N9166_01125 [bacterium]|nr:hypothetical protein [bacterium]